MKKKIAVVLCLVMVSMSLAGCSQAELDYLNMSKEMVADSYQVTGTMTGEVDFDALKTLADKINAKINTSKNIVAGSGTATVADEIFANLPQGKQPIKVTYTALVNMQDNMAMHVDFDMQMNGKTYNMGDMYFDAAKGIYLSKDTIIGFYDAYTDLVPNKYDSYFYSKEYRDGLSAAFASNNYTRLGYLEGLSAAEQSEVDGMLNGTFNKELYDAAYTFIETAFDDFTTGTVSKVNGGYQISLDGKQGKKLIVDMLQYFIDNIDKVITAYGDYMNVVVNNMNLSDEEKAQITAAFSTLSAKENQMMAAVGLAAVKQAFTEADKEGYMDFLDGFQYKAFVKKVGAGYTQSEDTSLKDGSKTAISLKTDSTVALKDVTISLPTSSIAFDALKDSVNALENKYNPVVSVNVKWGKYDNDKDFASLIYSRTSESPVATVTRNDSEPYFITDGRIYMPLRSICERLGENVAWDQAAKKAYVMHDGNKVDMTGVLKDGKTYIKIRDFEKLGYKINYSYDKETAMHDANIVK